MLFVAGGIRYYPRTGRVSAVLPDFDVVMHAWVKYSHPFGHRGAFHSIGFYAAFAVLCAAAAWFRGNRAVVAGALFSALLSHSLLDMLTNGGLGIARRIADSQTDRCAAPAWMTHCTMPWHVGCFAPRSWQQS